MIVVGLTGGVGMGKTSAAAEFSKFGFAVIDTDEIARKLVEPGEPALEEIVRVFGPVVRQPDGRLDRGALASIVFASEPDRKRLEVILHPQIRIEWKRQVTTLALSGTRVTMVVIPLLFETAAKSEFAHVISVACSPATQRSRLECRGWSTQETERRNAAQWPVKDKMESADFVLWNDGSRAALSGQCARVAASI